MVLQCLMWSLDHTQGVAHGWPLFPTRTVLPFNSASSFQRICDSRELRRISSPSSIWRTPTHPHIDTHTQTHLHTTIIHIYPKEAKQTPPYSPPNNPCPTPHPFLPSSLGWYGEEQEEALNVAKHGGGEFEPPIIIVCHHQHRRRLNQQQQQQQQQSPQSHLHLHTLFRWSFRIFPALSRQLRGTRTAPEIPPDWQDSAPRESHQETTGSSNMYYFFKYFYSTKKRYKKKIGVMLLINGMRMSFTFLREKTHMPIFTPRRRPYEDS